MAPRSIRGRPGLDRRSVVARPATVPQSAMAMDHREERPPGALAHGAAKSSDIERARDELGEAELRAARTLQAQARRHRRDASRRIAERPRERER